METTSELPADVLAFLDAQVESVPHLETLLLLWRSAPEAWTPDQIAARVYVSLEIAAEILRDLERRKLVLPSDQRAGSFSYDPAWDRSGELIGRVAEAHRHKLIPVAHRLHEKASGAVREFARAFEIKKDD